MLAQISVMLSAPEAQKHWLLGPEVKSSSDRPMDLKYNFKLPLEMYVISAYTYFFCLTCIRSLATVAD